MAVLNPNPWSDAEVVDLSSADWTPTKSSAARGLLVGAAGDIKVDTVAGSTLTLKSVPVGVLPLSVTKVYKVGTVASNITAGY